MGNKKIIKKIIEKIIKMIKMDEKRKKDYQNDKNETRI